jgi:hypothetical protein
MVFDSKIKETKEFGISKLIIVDGVVENEGILTIVISKETAEKQYIINNINSIGGRNAKQIFNYINEDKCQYPENTKALKKLPVASIATDSNIQDFKTKLQLFLQNTNDISMFLQEPDKPLFGLSKMGTGKKARTYKLSGDLGAFLGEYDRLYYSIVLRGEKGAGKSRLLFQLMNAFSQKALRVAFLCLEMHPASSPVRKYQDEYISKKNMARIDVSAEQLTFDQLDELCKAYDVVAIDSWTKLKGMKQDDFDRLQKLNPSTIIISIFQSTTGKVTRGGNMPEFDAGTVIQVEKGGVAICEKNRYSGDDLSYSVFERKIIKETKEVE